LQNPTPSIVRSQVVLCLAGHIDHGKSSLVHALTGGVVDRLPEERRRGMTIELGFAHFDREGIRFSFIDVPGHERFIHTMLAGASGVDLALLVVAADDSVMPQTREHVALLELLKVPRGVIALTKCDLVDAEQLELVHLEVAELVEPTFLSDAPVIETSTRNGQGIEEVARALTDVARSRPKQATDDTRFRLPIDRVFSPSGQGTVVTGTVWRGTARVGDVLHLLPSEEPVRVRRLQAQGAEVEAISAGERAAINLAGIKSSEIKRGDELATPSVFEPARRHLVRLNCLPDADRPLRHRELVRLHLAAQQTTAQILMGPREVAPGQSGFAVVRCASPIVAEYGQPFVVRQLSPARTVGGGVVIAPALRPADRLSRCLEAAPGLANADPAARTAAYVALRREAEFDPACESRIGLNRARFEAACRQLVDEKQIIEVAADQALFVTTARFRRLQRRIIDCCKRELAARGPARQLPETVILSAMAREASAPVLDAALADLISTGELFRRGDQIGPRVAGRLSHRQQKLLDHLIDACVRAGWTPPRLKDIAGEAGCSQRDLEPLVEAAVIDGRLTRLSPDFAIEPAALERLIQSLAGFLQSRPSFTISGIREHWGMTRKHAVPIFEYLDEHEITVRDGDLRRAGPRLQEFLREAAS
jgi:selenocysteine-specific elongation factor